MYYLTLKLKIKNEKLTLLLYIVIISFTSCSSDDDSSQVEDPFIGVWILISSDKNGVDRPLNDCGLKSEFTIKSDGTFIETSYYSEDDEPCRLSFADPGTWENLGNNLYRIKYDADADGDTYEEDISVNNNTFSVFYDEPYIYNYK